MTPGGLLRGQSGVGSLCEFFMTYSLGFLWSKGAGKSLLSTAAFQNVDWQRPDPSV